MCGKIGRLETQILVTQIFLSFRTIVPRPNKRLKRHGTCQKILPNPVSPSVLRELSLFSSRSRWAGGNGVGGSFKNN